MKRAVILLIILIIPLILAINVSAINLNMKENIKPGETLQAEIEGNFLSPLTQDDVYFYSDRLQIPLIFDIARIQDKYYIYALLPVAEKNYTLLIKQAHFFENGLEQTQDIQKSFSVEGNITDFSVTPGFIIASENFSITVESKNKALNIEAKFLTKSQNIQVPAGQKRKIYFSIDKIENFTLTNIEISALSTKYNVPSAIIPLSKINETKKNITEEKKFRFSNSEFNFSVNEDVEKNLFNLLDKSRRQAGKYKNQHL